MIHIITGSSVFRIFGHYYYCLKIIFFFFFMLRFFSLTNGTNGVWMTKSERIEWSNEFWMIEKIFLDFFFHFKKYHGTQLELKNVYDTVLIFFFFVLRFLLTYTQRKKGFFGKWKAWPLNFRFNYYLKGIWMLEGAGKCWKIF